MSSKSAPRSAAADTVTVSIDLTATEAAWKKQEARARALAPKAVNAARVDVTVAAAIALAGVRNVLMHREALAAAFRDPPLAVLERLPEDVEGPGGYHGTNLTRAPSSTPPERRAPSRRGRRP